MTTPLTEELLQQVVSQVLEECAFLCTQPDVEPATWPDHITRATIEFAGPQKGRLQLYAAHGLAMDLAADMLGVDATDPDASRLADGALAELTNVIAGALVARLFGTATLCELGIPVVEHQTPGVRSGGICSLTLVDLDGRPIDVRVSLGPPP